MGDSGLSRRRGECSWSVIGRGDREQKWLFLFLVCKILADQEHLGPMPALKRGRGTVRNGGVEVRSERCGAFGQH